MKSKMNEKQYIFILTFLIIFFILVFSYLDNKVILNNKLSWALDLAFDLNAIFNTQKGNFLITTIPGENIFWNFHSSGPFFLFMSFFVRLFKNNWFYFSLFKILWLFAGVIPIYLITKNKFNNCEYAVFFSLSYLFYPMFQIICLSDFKPLNMIITPLLFSFYFFETKRYLPANIFLFIALLIREEAIYLVASMLSFFFIRLLKKGKRY